MTILLALSITFAALLVIAVILMIVRYRHSKYTSSLLFHHYNIQVHFVLTVIAEIPSFTCFISSIPVTFILFAASTIYCTLERLIANDCVFLAIMIKKTSQ